jgi:hypothetical protein
VDRLDDPVRAAGHDAVLELAQGPLPEGYAAALVDAVLAAFDVARAPGSR